MEALLLSAGHGTRLLPLTKTYPKPLFPVLNLPSISYIMRHFASFGIRDFFINTFHLALAIEDEIPKFGINVRASFSREEKLLGTGGGIKRMLAKTSGDTVMISNTDAIYNFDLKDLVDSHDKSGSAITLGLIPYRQGSDYAKVSVCKDGLIRSFRNNDAGERVGIFTGIHVISKKMLPDFPKGDVFCIVEDYYEPYLKNGGKINSRFLEGDFLDIGDLKKYFESNLELLSDFSGFKALSGHLRDSYRETEHNIFVHKKTRLPGDLRMEPPAILGNCSVGKACFVGPHAIIDDGSRIGKNSRIRESVALCNSIIAEGATIERSILYNNEKIRLGPKALKN